MTVASVSGSIRSVTLSRSSKRARSSSTYECTLSSSSARVVNSPWRRNVYRMKSAKSSSRSRARSGSVLMYDAITLSAL